MATWLKQSTAVEIKMGPYVDSTDGNTQETGLTISQADVRLAKNGGDWAQKNESTTLVHEEAGWYRCLLDTTDTDTLGILIVATHESGALPVWREFHVLKANVYDSLIAGTDSLDVEVASMAANVVTAAAIATGAIDADAIADGAIDAGAFAADAITAAKVAADVSAEIADQVWDEAIAGHLTAGSTGAALNAVGTPATAAAIADAVWDEALADHVGAGSAGLALGTVETESATAAEIATAIWAKAASELSAVPDPTSTFGELVEFIFAIVRNKRTQTTSLETLFKDDETTTLATSSKSDVAGTFTRGQYS